MSDNKITANDWTNFLINTQTERLPSYRNEKTGVFYAKNEEEIAKYPQLSIKEISLISKKIINETVKEQEIKTIKLETFKLIKYESEKARKEVEKVNSFWLNAAKWISYASILFIPIGKLIHKKQELSKVELKTIQNLQAEWESQSLATWEQKTIGQALSKKTWEPKTDPINNFKNVLQDALTKEKKTSLGNPNSSVSTQYMITKQANADITRARAIYLNNKPIYENYGSLKNTENAFKSLITAFNETDNHHPITDGVLIALSQSLGSDIPEAMIEPDFKANPLNYNPPDGLPRIQNASNKIYEIGIHENELTIEIKSLSYELSIESNSIGKFYTARATSRKFTMPLEELKDAVEKIEGLKGEETKGEPLNFLPNLKGQDRISDELFKRSNKDQKKITKDNVLEYINQDIELIGINRSIKSPGDSQFPPEVETQILKSFRPTSESQGIFDPQKAWERLKKDV